ncbi:ABC transporter ATP-binding protein [Dactylosporangium siamense]|uniref:Daunorubicin resistance protein DrrA family ABC transporter ATP-binding protein n=1 Tax=Dactylosporangium siamense TaxID=685454 RepID=A0A919PNI2_9ACTN|nr:ABC transporter ATP-binding protein [Dactylosporangium siamense]GIG47104.1 daunorubicin resistance protein DrrA family ABC transporter ATP-binding protein [Dactylosporangium siamense]
MLHADGLTKRYGAVLALNGFNLDVAPGEITGLVGHNGAGKSTFVDVLCGLVRPDSGTVTFNGRPLAAARGDIGVAPQHIALYPGATAGEHLRLYGRLAGLRGRALTTATDEVIDALLLTDFLDRRVGLLSGGQQRRVQAATALLPHPPLLLMDEPTAGADPQTRESLLAALRHRAAGGTAIVYATHYLPELADLQATVAVARHGRIIARGTTTQLLDGLPSEVLLRTAGTDDLRVHTTDPARTLTTLLQNTSGPIVEIDIRKPSLDDLYRSLAG